MRALWFLALPVAVHAATSTAQPAPARLTIDVQSYRFTPRPITLAAGTPVTLTFVNRAGKGHDFTAPEFFAAAKIISGSAPRGEIELPAGASVSLTLIPARGTYQAHCGHFLHAAIGMKDQIVVR